MLGDPKRPMFSRKGLREDKHGIYMSTHRPENGASMLRSHFKQIYTVPDIAKQILLPIRYAKLLPTRQDGAIILPASQHMNHYLPAAISY